MKEGMVAKSYPSTKDPLKLSHEECHPRKRPTRCINIESNLSGVVGGCTNQSSETRAASAKQRRRLNRNRSRDIDVERMRNLRGDRCSFNSSPPHLKQKVEDHHLFGLVSQYKLFSVMIISEYIPI